MKKNVLSLAVALLLTLCLCTCAMAETVAAFPFTTEQYVESFQTAYQDAVATQDEGAVVLEMQDGSPVRVLYDMNGQCTSLSTEVKIPLTQSDAASSEGEKLGYSAVAIMTSAREIELNHDDEAILADLNPMIQSFTELLTSFSDEDYESCITQPVTHEMEICTHPAQMTFSFDLAAMALVMTFTYLP